MERGSLVTKLNLKGRNSLCQKCQVWDSVSAVIEPFDGIRGQLTLAELSTKLDCLICPAIFIEFDTRRTISETMRSLTSSEILVRNDGPFFLDGGTWPRIIADHASRIDSSYPKRVTVRVIIKP
ncbi:hypothetical protein BDZ45DRAFT_745075 [Acephala macrosclerotiorum]|nr:hypothetical protein BDZ45DRAFT_745075 [Acephala macrosclerotiorum]